MLAIVIPFYKLNFFEKTLFSLSSQTNKNFSVYIGNDASPDDPLPVINTFKKDLQIEYRRFDKNFGGFSLTSHWNRCINLTGGEEWLMILGDDDYLSSSCIQNFYDRLEEIKGDNIKVVRFATQEINDEGEFISAPFVHPDVQEYEEVFLGKFFGNSRSSLSEYIFAKQQFEKFGFRDLPLAWHTDDLAVLEFSEFGKIYTINESLVFFRLSNFNISRHSYLTKEKEIASYQFYTIIVNEFLNKFSIESSQKILKRFELLTYKLNKGSFQYFVKYIPVILNYNGLWETLKFSRRVYLNKK